MRFMHGMRAAQGRGIDSGRMRAWELACTHYWLNDEIVGAGGACGLLGRAGLCAVLKGSKNGAEFVHGR